MWGAAAPGKQADYHAADPPTLAQRAPGGLATLGWLSHFGLAVNPSRKVQSKTLVQQHHQADAGCTGHSSD